MALGKNYATIEKILWYYTENYGNLIYEEKNYDNIEKKNYGTIVNYSKL